MRAVKVKAIRRALRAELANGTTRYFVAHPKRYKNALNEPMLGYSFQYIIGGGKKLVKAAKKIYRAVGILPRITNG